MKYHKPIIDFLSQHLGLPVTIKGDLPQRGEILLTKITRTLDPYHKTVSFSGTLIAHLGEVDFFEKTSFLPECDFNKTIQTQGHYESITFSNFKMAIALPSAHITQIIK